MYKHAYLYKIKNLHKYYGFTIYFCKDTVQHNLISPFYSFLYQTTLKVYESIGNVFRIIIEPS